MDASFLLPMLLLADQQVQNGAQSPSSSDSKASAQDFNAVLRLLMAEQITASFGQFSSGDSSTAGLFDAGTGSSALGSMLPLMESLVEQLLSQQVQTDAQSTPSATTITATPPASSLQSAGEFHHINQFVADIQEGGDGINADCGPTSLVMALHQLGLNVAGEAANASDGKAIDLARLSMASSRAKDGVDANGNRSDAEHNTFTDFNDLARGASRAGAKNRRLSPNTSAIKDALDSGASVIVSGTFAGKYPLPWTGDRGVDNHSAPGNATAHLIEVSSYDPATKMFTINDPARLHSNQVSASALRSFMSGNAGAMALWRK
jgi:Peptidase_C39 like family